jgi:spermidine synthase
MASLRWLLRWIWSPKLRLEKGSITPLLEISIEDGKKVLNAGRVNYSFGTLHTVFQFALKKARIAEQDLDDVLILGFGAGSIASIIVNELHLSPNIYGVEADEAVIRIAKKHFNADEIPGLVLIHERAENFIAASRQSFDFIAVDVFVEENVPEACQSGEFLRNLHRILRPGGCVVFNQIPKNVSGPGKSEFAKRFRKCFPGAEIDWFQQGDLPNEILIGRKG